MFKSKVFFRKIIWLLVTLILLVFLGFSLFKNISYPLMWGDEAETAMLAERILDFGYPKIHAKNNSLILAMISGENTGVKAKYDANIVSMWGQYYFAAIGAYFARFVSDYFTKTLILRLPFALIGLIGVLILPFSVLSIAKPNVNKKYIFFSLYLFLQILSVSLILHLKEVRSYSMAVFLLSMILIVFNFYYFGKRKITLAYMIPMTLLLFVLQNTFPPGFLVAIVSIGVYIVFDRFIRDPEIRKDILNKGILVIFKSDIFKLLLPLFIAVIISLPILVFFETSKTSRQSYLDMHFGFSVYFSYVVRIITFLWTYHFLALAIFIKVLLMTFYSKMKKVVGLVKNDAYQKLTVEIKVSNFLTYFLTVYVFLSSFTPYMFDRYFIFLQPLLALIIIYDLFIVFEIILTNKDREVSNNRLSLTIFGVTLVFLLSLVTKVDVLNGRIYELTHRYYGPVDKIIMYIKDNYKYPERLTIATNLEQTSYIYYLGSSVICDENSDCIKNPPDILLPRRYGLVERDIKRYEEYLKNAKYELVYLPILDYPSNNIPEFSLSLRHLFKTPETTDKNGMVVMYRKVNTK
jgi:hypothetical protein